MYVRVSIAYFRMISDHPIVFNEPLFFTILQTHLKAQDLAQDELGDSVNTYTWRRIDGCRRIWRLRVVGRQFSNGISNVVRIEGTSVVGKHATRRRDSDT